MARRFAPIPHDAYDGLEDGDALAILDLYMRGHNMRWRPRKVTERGLAKKWGVSGRRVWIILETLADLDLLTFEKGTNRKASIVTVFDTTKGAKSAEDVNQEGRQGGRQEGQQTGRQGGRQNSAGSNGESVDPEALLAALLEAQDEAQGEALLAALLLRLRPETEPEKELEPTPETEDKSASPPAVQDMFRRPIGQATPKADKPAKVNKRAAAQRIYEAYRLHHLDEPEVPSKGDGRKITARLTELAQQFKGKRRRYIPEDWATAEQDLADLTEWIHTAPDASFWQGDNDRNREYLGITPIFKTDKFSDRLKSMRAWRKGGRGTKTKTYSGDRGDIAPAPEPQGPQTTGMQWKRLGELDDIVKDKASTGEQVDAALAEIELIESNPGAPLP